MLDYDLAIFCLLIFLFLYGIGKFLIHDSEQWYLLDKETKNTTPKSDYKPPVTKVISSKANAVKFSFSEYTRYPNSLTWFGDKNNKVMAILHNGKIPEKGDIVEVNNKNLVIQDVTPVKGMDKTYFLSV